ncbi:hypothetical protein BSZ39_09040 [Bowdeniella nasicola]|uniref:RNA helicase n=1 Tax=Bowdeniella nasicola TaxID=208480 RepID=A0A1Q5Q0Y5_9ACTO|nr:hypothetical protein BSZ39_09040 [Bowdeniella nasicola]
MTTFADLGLPAELLQTVTDLGFTAPTDIQREAIPPLLAGRDVVGIAQTGTGKTAAFGLPLLAGIDPQAKEVQALVLCPTRELALQGSDAITTFAGALPDIDIVAVYGGSAYQPQMRALKRGAQVVVGTPGRIMDLIEKGALDLSHVRVLVLDEADEMLRMGFAEDVEVIASNCPKERTTALFSATMPAAITKVSKQHLTDPVRVEVTRQASTVDTVEQQYAVVPFRHKNGALFRVLATSSADAAIVFVRTRATAEDVTADLTSRGIAAAALSSDVPQKERERLVERLRGGSLNVIIATDVAARGLDVERIGLVVNFDVPREGEAYVHRIGRTGRAGRSGRALTFFTPKEKHRLRQIERLTGSDLAEIRIPSPKDVSAHRVGQLLAGVPARIEAGRLELYREAIADSGIDTTDLAAALLALAVQDTGPNTDDDEVASTDFDDPRSGKGRGQGRVRSDGSGTRYRVEVGHKDNVIPGALVGAITGEGGLKGSDVGKIDIFPTFSLVDIFVDLDNETLRTIGRAQVQGRALKIRPDRGPKHSGRGNRSGGFSQSGYRGKKRREDAGRWDKPSRKGYRRKNF